MRNLDYREDPMERAAQAQRAYEAVQALIGATDDLESVNCGELGALLDILNRELALSLRDAFTPARVVRQAAAHRYLKELGALIDPDAPPPTSDGEFGMRNWNYQEDPMDRAEHVQMARDAVQTLVAVAHDLGAVDRDELAALLDILNRELALSLRDAFKTARDVQAAETHRRPKTAGALVDPDAPVAIAA